MIDWSERGKEWKSLEIKFCEMFLSNCYIPQNSQRYFKSDNILNF